MALSSTGVWEIRSGGNELNAGFFNPASTGTDYSQQDAAQLSLSDVVTDGTTTVTSSTGGFTSAMLGNGIVIAGTVYEVTAHTNSNTISIDRNATSGSGQNAKVGGALASPGKVAGLMVSGNQVWLKGSFAIISTTPNVAGGIVSLTVGGTGSNTTLQGMSVWRGYGTTRGDSGRATLQASGISSVTLFSFDFPTAAYSKLINIVFDGNAQTSIRAASGGNPGNWVYVENCVAKNCTDGGFWYFSSVFASEIANCSGASGIDNCSRIIETTVFGQTGGECGIAVRTGVALNCLIHNCTVAGIRVDSGGSIWDCRVFACDRGFGAYGYPRDDLILGCVAWGCTSYNYANGFNAMVIQCAGGGAPNPDYNAVGVIPLTVNPFVDSSAGNFQLTSAAAAQLTSAGMNLQTAWLGVYMPRRSIVL